MDEDDEEFFLRNSVYCVVKDSTTPIGYYYD